MNPNAIAGFLAAIFPLVATPGASLTLLTRHVTSEGRRAAIPVILGTISGLYVHATLAAAGLSALVMHSSQAFEAIRIAGAIYLIALGIATWRSARPRPPRKALPFAVRSTYLQALLGNVLNPKAASIFLTLVPQFLNPHRALAPQILILATAQASLITIWLLAWCFLLSGTMRAAGRTRLKSTFARISGAMLIAIGLRSATA